MGHRNVPAHPAPAELDALFVAECDYQGDGSNCGHIMTSLWGEVEAHCKTDGSLLIPPSDERAVAWFSPIEGNFHTGHSFPSGYLDLHRSGEYIKALEGALQDERFYRLIPAREVAPDLPGIKARDALLWRHDGLFLRRAPGRKQDARVVCIPLSHAWWFTSKMKNWREANADVLREALSSSGAEKALAKAIGSFSTQPRAQFWSHVRCERVEVSDLHAALIALRRLQLLGWLPWPEPEEPWWIGLDRRHSEITTVVPLHGFVASGNEEGSHLVNALLQATNARLQISDFLDVTMDAQTHLLRRSVFWNIPSAQSEDEEIASWTMHDRLEAVCAWNSVAAQLDSPLVQRVRAPQNEQNNR